MVEINDTAALKIKAKKPFAANYQPLNVYTREGSRKGTDAKERNLQAARIKCIFVCQRKKRERERARDVYRNDSDLARKLFQILLSRPCKSTLVFSLLPCCILC